MKLAIAGFAHETVTFLPRETGLEAFEREARRGPAVIEGLRGTNTDGGGFVAACGRAGVEPVGLVYATTAPSGPVSEAAYEHYSGEIVERLAELAGSVDGLLLHLHGAMATTERQDPETDLVRDLRAAVGPDFPIALSMDLHGNLAPELLDHATVVCGYHESPHVDMARTGERAADLLIRAMRGEASPVCAVAKPGLVLPSIFTATTLSPLADLMARARAAESRPGILDTTIFTGFAYADVAPIGFAAVVVADGDRAAAAGVAAELADAAAGLRHELYKRDLLLPVDEAVARARAVARTAAGPVVLLEHADRMNDSTYCLRALLDQGVARVAVPCLWDPAAVAAALEAGVGARVTLEVGGRSSDRAGGPVGITGTVRFAGPGRYRATGRFRRGALIDLGDAAVIETEGVTLILTSNSVTAVDEDPFLRFGMRASDFDIIVLRSKTHFRAAYEPLAAEILIVETPDWGPADLGTLPYRNVPPGVFPITASEKKVSDTFFSSSGLRRDGVRRR